jgi:hypothetical protein
VTYPQQPGFPPVQMPQQPQAPQAPQGYAPPQQYGPPQGYPQQYAPQQFQQPQYGPPQGYPQQQYAPQGPAQQPAEASLSAFFSQPSVGWGPSITPVGKTPDGTAYLMVVAQHITKAHIEHSEEYQKPGVLAYYRNGQPKFTMKVPVYVAPGTQVTNGQGQVSQIDDGRAQLFVQGGNKDLLASAMSMVGAPDGPPELGAVILVTKTGNRPNRSGTMSAVATYQYWRPGPEAQQFAAQSGIAYPDLSAPKPADAVPSAPPAAPQAPVQPVNPYQGAQQAVAADQHPIQQAAAQQAPAPPVQAPVQPAAPAQPQPPAPVANGGLSAEQQALLAQLTGQPAG